MIPEIRVSLYFSKIFIITLLAFPEFASIIPLAFLRLVHIITEMCLILPGYSKD